VQTATVNAARHAVVVAVAVDTVEEGDEAEVGVGAEATVEVATVGQAAGGDADWSMQHSTKSTRAGFSRPAVSTVGAPGCCRTVQLTVDWNSFSHRTLRVPEGAV